MRTLDQFLKENEIEHKTFEPSPLYTPEGDSLMFYIKDEDSYSERIDDLLTVYRSITTNQIIGCQIKGVRHKLDELSKFLVTVTSQEFELVSCFWHIWQQRPTKRFATITNFSENRPKI
jgi:hypothetical protein